MSIARMALAVATAAARAEAAASSDRRVRTSQLPFAAGASGPAAAPPRPSGGRDGLALGWLALGWLALGWLALGWPVLGRPVRAGWKAVTAGALREDRGGAEASRPAS